MNKYVIGAVIVAFLGFAAKSVWDQSRPAETAFPGEQNPIVTVQLPASFSAEAQAGKLVFEANCAACHGANAAGNNGFGPPLVHKIYEPNHHGDITFFMAAQNGVTAHHWPFGNMAPVEGVSEDEVRSIIAYVRELQVANGIS